MEKLLDCQGTQTVTAIEADVAWHSLEMCLVDGWHERSAQGWSKGLSGANSFVFFLVIYDFSFSKALTFLILLYFKKNSLSNSCEFCSRWSYCHTTIGWMTILNSHWLIVQTYGASYIHKKVMLMVQTGAVLLPNDKAQTDTSTIVSLTNDKVHTDTSTTVSLPNDKQSTHRHIYHSLIAKW